MEREEIKDLALTELVQRSFRLMRESDPKANKAFAALTEITGRMDVYMGKCGTEAKQLLQERLDGNYRDYMAKLQAKPVSEVIALAPEITAAKQLHEELADALMDDEIQFLLKLENPLEALVGSWEAELSGVHDEEMSHMLWSMRERDLFSKEDFLPEQAPEADTPQPQPKPKMDLIGHDGNIYAIMGRASGLLKDAGMKEQSDEMIRRVTSSGSYDEALHIVSEYVETELSPVAELRKKKMKKEKNSHER